MRSFLAMFPFFLSRDRLTKAAAILLVGLTAILVPGLPARADLSVAIYLVDLTGMSADAKFYACGNPQLAGPFMSAATSIEWRNEFLQTQDTDRIIATWNTEPGVCSTSPWFHDNDWHQ
jgi:hypothetical protein